jgi:sulfoxide reductase heme-binding subunit YedZ
MATVAIGTHFFWITSRAAGIVALILASAAVGVGVSIRGPHVDGRGVDLRVIHEALALATIAALVLHATALLGDSYFQASIADISIPFARDYREPYMAIGIIAGWGLLLLGLSYYARKRIGIARWRVLHRFTALAWLLGVIHTLGEGSDAGRAWFLAMVAIAVLPVLALILARILRRARSSAARTAGWG